jgi:hypothetical protein
MRADREATAQYGTHTLRGLSISHIHKLLWWMFEGVDTTEIYLKQSGLEPGIFTKKDQYFTL